MSFEEYIYNKKYFNFNLNLLLLIKFKNSNLKYLILNIKCIKSLFIFILNLFNFICHLN